MRRFILLVLLLVSISSSVFAECRLDETRWKRVSSAGTYVIYYDKNTAVIKSPAVFEVWTSDYYSGGVTCKYPACINAGLDKIEHYHDTRVEFNSENYTFLHKELIAKDNRRYLLYSIPIPTEKQIIRSISPESMGERIMKTIKQDLYNR